MTSTRATLPEKQTLIVVNTRFFSQPVPTSQCMDACTVRLLTWKGRKPPKGLHGLGRRYVERRGWSASTINNPSLYRVCVMLDLICCCALVSKNVQTTARGLPLTDFFVLKTLTIDRTRTACRAESSHQPFRRREGAMANFRDIKTLQK